MNKENIDKIQERVIALLRTLSADLRIAAKDQCSEMARLVGCWILDAHPEYKVQIFKGELSDGMAHDILVIEDGKEFFLIDPTIWQIFPESNSILVESVGSSVEAISALQMKYGGLWKVSEVMEKCDKGIQQELLDVIKNNG